MQHSNHTDDNTNNWILSAIIGFFTFLESCSPETIYTWIFRSLTVMSLVLMIIINWKKAWQTIFPNKKTK